MCCGAVGTGCVDNVTGVVEIVAPVVCNVFAVEMSWDVGRYEVLDAVVEMVEVLDMVVVELVVDKDTSVVVWAVVAWCGNEYGQGYVMAARQIE